MEGPIRDRWMEPLGRLPLHLTLEGAGPLYKRLYRSLRAAILDGRLPPGERLPSTRSLATALGLSRNVVLLAFDQLLAEGYTSGRVGSGTFVSKILPDSSVRAWRTPVAPHPMAPTRPSRHARRAAAVQRLPAAGAAAVGGGMPIQYDFRYGTPAYADFPHETWRRLLARRARAISVRSLSYGPAEGYPPLREAIAAYLRRSRGVAATSEQVVIVNGSQQALDLTTRLLIDDGDRVVVEEPSYASARHIFAAAGARLVLGPVDENGLVVDRLPRRGTVRLAYVTPSHQFPAGSVLSLARRFELLRWAEKVRAHVLEDDYDSEFHYEGRPLAAVQGLDRSGRVLYAGTFSKVLFPSLRIGYLVVPSPLIPTLAAVRWLADCHTPTFEQEVLTEFIAEGHFENHLLRSRARYASRRAALVEALAQSLGSRVRLAGAAAGVHVVAWLKELRSTDLPALVGRAAEKGVGIYPVTPHFVHPPREAGLLLGYASLDERAIAEGVRRLAAVLDER
jgi:GntR family transcriptional regulator/MocR family aminotransferase